jgi:hypothetical protein
MPVRSNADGDRFLWDVLRRFDHYVASTNAKGALLVAYNSFVAGALVLKWEDVATVVIGSSQALKGLVIVLIIIVALATLIALSTVFGALVPYLASPKRVGKYHSHIYFEHVAERGDANDYLEAFSSATEQELMYDLGTQVHAVAQGLRRKFRLLRATVLVMFWGQLLPMALLLVVRVGVTLAAS